MGLEPVTSQLQVRGSIHTERIYVMSEKLLFFPTV